MSTSDTNKRKFLLKNSIVYVAISLLCVVISNVYALFGHGIRSDYMDSMFLYPLLGGVMYLLALALSDEHGGMFRLGKNVYNSAIAALTAGSMLRGIVEIAGTDSDLIILFFVFGWGGVLLGGIMLLLGAMRDKK